MTDRMSNSFRSYIDIGAEEHELQTLNASREESFTDQQSPRLLPGEVVISEAKNVLFFVPLSERNHGWSGSLFVTNFKLSFITRNGAQKESTGCQQSFLLDDSEVSLSNIDAVFQVSKDKKRRLTPGNNVTTKIKGIQIFCKTMRILTFSFKFSPVNSGKNIANVLLHHAFPQRHQLLFAYDYREPSYHCNNEVCMFQDHSDWLSELKRTECFGWRVSLANQHYQLSPNLPPFMVVPDSVLDWQLGDAARHFRGSRPPIWCWGSADGAALVRMADMLPNISDRVQENVMLEHVRKAHPRRKQPHIIDLQRILPAPREVQQSFLKLRDICSPDSVRQFWGQDSNFFSQLDASKWLHIVSACLASALESSHLIVKSATVVLQEGEGRDLSAVVCSLVQLLCDSSSRSIVGFQSLIQKEWVSLGHPFCSRLGLVAGTDQEQSPIFLIFLDCVWQLLNQFPSEFEFSETYLTTLWDSCHIGVFDTFLFDCVRDRKCAEIDTNNPLPLRNIWDWEEQFAAQDIALFRNPLFSVAQSNTLTAVNGSKNTVHQMSQLSLKGKKSHKCPLPVNCGLSSLELWMQCYCRWLPMLEIVGGGRPQVNFQTHLLVDEIIFLKNKLTALKNNQSGSVVPFNFSDELSFSCDSEQLRSRLQSNPNSFFPFTHHGISSTELLLNSSVLGEEEEEGVNMMDSQSSLNITD